MLTYFADDVLKEAGTVRRRRAARVLAQLIDRDANPPDDQARRLVLPALGSVGGSAILA